jgi:hypothetical protein
VPGFLADMDVFRRASGQGLNMTKVELLVVGAPPPGAAGGAAVLAPAVGGGLPPVVSVATALGVQCMDWHTASPAVELGGVLPLLSKAARLPVSMFGRAAAVSSYALGKVLYHLEFLGLPKPSVLKPFLSRVAAVVDRRLSPERYDLNSKARPPGVSLSVMALPSAVGGFGLLPLVEHVQARHAVLAVRCVLGACGLLPAPPPWARVADALLRLCHPAATPLCLLGCSAVGVLGRGTPEGVPAFRRLLGAVALLPPVVLVRPPAPGSWVYHVPLWGNPALRDGEACFDVAFADLFAVPGLDSVGRLVAVYDGLRGVLACSPLAPAPGQARMNDEVYEQVWRAVLMWPRRRRMPVPLLGPPSPGLAAVRVAAAVALLPAGWAEAARSVPPNTWCTSAVPPRPVSVRTLVGGLGWAVPGQEPVVLSDVTVKIATGLQLQPRYDELRRHHLSFVVDAGVPAPEQLAALANLSAVIARLWELRWENCHKEAFWRIAVNGCWAFPMHAAMLARGGAVPCCAACGLDMSGGDRVHHFWDCVMALSLREHLGLLLGAPVGALGSAFSRAELWLVRPPLGVAPPVWDVVCLAALSALDVACQRAVMSRKATGVPLSSGARAALQAATVSAFWGRLQSFASLGVVRRNWDVVPTQHPFLARGANGGVVLVPPPDFESPPPSP